MSSSSYYSGLAGYRMVATNTSITTAMKTFLLVGYSWLDQIVSIVITDDAVLASQQSPSTLGLAIMTLSQVDTVSNTIKLTVYGSYVSNVSQKPQYRIREKEIIDGGYYSFDVETIAKGPTDSGFSSERSVLVIYLLLSLSLYSQFDKVALHWLFITYGSLDQISFTFYEMNWIEFASTA